MKLLAESIRLRSVFRVITRVVLLFSVFSLSLMSAQSAHASICVETNTLGVETNTCVGTHLAHFDRGAQIGVLGHIQGLVPRGYPVVVNVDYNWSTEEIQELADAANGLTIVIRVVGDLSEVAPQTLTGFGRDLNGVDWGESASPKPIVTLGNELNNLSVEWGDPSTTTEAAGTKYASLYNFFRSELSAEKYDIAPVALDQYNTRYPWLEFGRAIRAAYATSPAFAINIYGSDLSWTNIPDTLNVPLTDKRSIFTEWGPMPPDSPLSDYDAWYTSTPVPDGVEFAVALVSNICLPSAPKFGTFYWVYGKMYSLIGNQFQEVDPRLCPDDENFVFDESRTVDDEVSGVYVYKDIFADVVAHGGSGNYERALQAGLSRAQRYVMSCAPQFWIGAQVDPENVPFYWSRLNEQMMTLREYCGGYVEENRGPAGFNEPNCVFNPITANFQIMNTNLSTPLYRRAPMSADGEFYNSNRAESFESFFGVNTRIGRETGNAILHSPNSKILNEVGQCVQAVNYLKAIDVLCKEPQAHNFTAGSFEDDNRTSETCALDNLVTIEGPAFDQRYLEIYREVREWTGDLDPVEYCLIDRERLATAGELKYQLLDSKLKQIQPIMKNAFKIGYLVYYNNSRFFMDQWDPLVGAVGVALDPENDAFSPASRYFHPVYRSFEEFFNEPTFDIIPFLVPAGVFSSNQHEEILVNPADPLEDYEPKADAAFDSSYTTVLRAFLSTDQYETLLNKGRSRKAAIGSAIEFGMVQELGNYGTMWNGLNNSGNERPFIHCPFCDPAFDLYPTNHVQKKIETNYDVFASVIWHRINGGIYAKEVTEHLFQPEPNPQVEEDTELNILQPLPDDWNRCQVAPELVRGETARNLVTPGSNSLWGTVKNSITNLRALVRAPSGMREDKYNYEIRGFILLPEEYGFLADTESVLMRTVLPLEYQDDVFAKEMKYNEFSQYVGQNELDGGYIADTPTFNRFLRLNGQVWSLADTSEDDAAIHGAGTGSAADSGGRGPYYVESPEEYAARSAEAYNEQANACLQEIVTPEDALECFSAVQRRRVTVTAKLNSWNVGWNEGQTDLRPLLPGGILARGIFTIMAQVLSPVGGPNYQLEYCGLEDYWAVGGCADNPVLTSCDEFRNSVTVMPNTEGAANIIREIAAQYGVPADMLWGIYIIEGGTARNKMYEGGGEVACTVNSAGAVGPMQHLKNACRSRGDFPEDVAAFEKNVCDFRVAIEVAADRISRFSRADEFRHNGAPNWYWIAGQYYWGSRYKLYQDFETGKCSVDAPAVQGCPESAPDYCSCAVEGFPIPSSSRPAVGFE